MHVPVVNCYLNLAADAVKRHERNVALYWLTAALRMCNSARDKRRVALILAAISYTRRMHSGLGFLPA